MWPCCSHRAHCAQQAAVAEEDDEEGDAEVEDEHVDDEGGVVDLGLRGVVVDPAGTLHSLRDVPAGAPATTHTHTCLASRCQQCIRSC